MKLWNNTHAINTETQHEYEFDFQGYSRQEILAFQKWFKKQSHSSDYPEILVVRNYNETLPMRSRLDEGSNILSVVLAYCAHCEMSRIGGLKAAYPELDKIENQARSDGYNFQTQKTYGDDNTQFYYDHYYLKAAMLRI
jgi:hypothetical protein